jgi:hypothetical protein
MKYRKKYMAIISMADARSKHKLTPREEELVRAQIGKGIKGRKIKKLGVPFISIDEDSLTNFLKGIRP